MQAEESRIAVWQAAIKEGDMQLDRDEGVAYTPEMLNDITQSAVCKHSGKPMNPDVRS